MAEEAIVTWYQVSGVDKDGKVTETQIGTGTTLNFGGVEAGEQSVVKCVRLKFSRKIAKLRFWVVNNISGTSNSGGVFEDGWCHGYHIRTGGEVSQVIGTDSNGDIITAKKNSPFLPLDNDNFASEYYNSSQKVNEGKTPVGYEEYNEKELPDDIYSNYNSFVSIPRDTQFFTSNPNYDQWSQGGGFGNFNSGDYTPYIYLVVTPPLSADGGSRSGWGYRISFLYSDDSAN